MASSVGLLRSLEGREVVSARVSCGSGHGVTPFGGNDTANSACSGGRWARLFRAGCRAAAVAIALLDHLRLEAQWPSDTLEFLPRRKTAVSMILNH